MKCRKNVKNLSPAERENFARAVNLLKNEPSVVNPGGQNRYDDFAKAHLDTMTAGADWTHGDSAFFPWHRELIYHFELELDRMVPGVTIPFWDWTREQSAIDTGFPFRHDFIGVDGDDGQNDEVQREVGAASPYPYEFDPEDWDIVVKDNDFDSDRLRRAFGERGDAPNLPENDAVVVGVGSTFREALDAADYLELRDLSEGDHHNLVHRWVGGNMLQRSSPNDPVFFMHHAAIDRMWTIWQEKNPGLPAYVNISGLAGHGLNDNMIFNFAGETPPWSDVTRPVDIIDGHNMHGDSVWYETDLPEIFDIPDPTLNFGNVPNGLTQYRAAKFRVRSCRPLRFRITAVPDNAATNFDVTPLGTTYSVMPNSDGSPVDVFIWFQYLSDGPSPNASITIVADFLDDEGYLADNPGDYYQLGTYDLTLTATSLAREDNSVVLVLDRSYSMIGAAGGGSTRSDLMKSAVGVFHTLLQSGDEFGVVSFDHLTEDLLPLTTQSAGLGTTLTGNGLDPRGNTAIGQGILDGNNMLAGATHSNKSMLVLTDGNENVDPLIDDLPAGTITNKTYAIGFGLQGSVSDAALNKITQNTDGDLIITGNLTSLDEQYLLTKYFVQVLAEVTSANVVLDPGGELGFGDEHKIPFIVSGADLEIDVICLSSYPKLIEFWLETPSGDKIVPGDDANFPNVEFKTKPDVAFYRLKLPALPGDPTKSHVGKWTAHLRLIDRDQIKKLLSKTRNLNSEMELAFLANLFKQGTQGYELLVHTRSNLDFSARLRQKSLEPGAKLTLSAKLDEYRVPYRGNADVWADVTRPDGSDFSINLGQLYPGLWEADITAKEAGIYKARVRATGGTSGGTPFTREKSLTATIFSGGDNPRNEPRPGTGGGLQDREFYCRLIKCLLEDKSVRHWMKRNKLDLRGFKKCLKKACKRKSKIKGLAALAILSGKALTRTDLAEMAAMIRRELKAVEPGRVVRSAVNAIEPPAAPQKPKAANAKRKTELFQMSPKAAAMMKKAKARPKMK